MVVFTKPVCSVVLLIMALFAINTVYAQQTIKGIYLINSETKIPVPDADVENAVFTFFSSADENGFVNLRKMPPSITQLQISRIGYKTKMVGLDSMHFADGTAIIYMDNKVSGLNDVTVKAVYNGNIFKTISDLDIHLRPINNSQEVLRMVPGLFIGQHAGGGKSEQIFLRGFDIDHGTDINLSVDGMPVNMVSHAHGQGYADLHFIIPELIEKVNFNKGPYYADKGNFTTAGFVEFKTKNFLENNFAKMEAGQYGTFRSIAGLNLLKPTARAKNQSLYAAGEASFTKGYFDSPQNFYRYNGQMKYYGNISPNNTITASVMGFCSKWNASGQIPERAVNDGSVGFYGAIDNTEGGNTHRYNGMVELSSNLVNGGVLKNQLFYSRYAFELYSNFTFFKEDPVNGDQIRQKENRNIYGYNSSYSKSYTIAKLKSTTNAGVQLRYDDINDIELSRTKNRNEVTNAIMSGDINELNAGMYWMQNVTVSKKLNISAGLRTDYFANKYKDIIAGEQLKSNSFIVSPKLNFNYQASEKLQLYWNNGRGFHSNDTRVAVKQNGKKVLPPAWGTDVGAVTKIGNKLVLQTALWYLWLQQEFVYVGDEGVVEPGGKTKRVGVDLSVRYEVVKNLYADVDLSVANARALKVPARESYLPLAPRVTSVGGLTYKKQQGLNGSLRYRFMDDRPANEDYSVIAKGYFVADAAINYNKKKWEAGISVQNLFNTKWKETQFDTESRLKNDPAPVSEIHFTPGTPFFARLSVAVFF